MQSLPSNLFDHFRSWLTFAELHKNRRVSARWRHVGDVEKVVDLDDQFLPFANFDNITSLSVEEMKGSCLELTKLYEIMTHNQTSLSKISFDFYYSNPRSMAAFASALPEFPNATEFKIRSEDDDEGMSRFYRNLITRIPKVKFMTLENLFHFQTFDFSALAELESLRIEKDNTEYEIKNAEQGKLKELTIFWHAEVSNADYPMLPVWVELFSDVEVTFAYGIKLGENLKIKECIWTKSTLSVKKIEINVDAVEVKKTAEKLKEFIGYLQSIRPHPPKVDIDFKDHVADTDRLAFSLVIARMKQL